MYGVSFCAYLKEVSMLFFFTMVIKIIVPVTHFVHLMESCGRIKILLNVTQYGDNKMKICVEKPSFRYQLSGGNGRITHQTLLLSIYKIIVQQQSYEETGQLKIEAFQD